MFKQNRSYLGMIGMMVLVLLISTLAINIPAMAADGDPTELFFSEYIEGSSYNKALEIYNGTGGAIDLATGVYSIEIYFNGGDTSGNTIPLSGIIADGDVFIVADDSADPAILAETDIAAGGNFFNGDDTILLLKDGVVIDSIGQLGVDPGSYFGSGDTTTADHTLRRLEAVCAGDTNPDDAFDPTLEWNGYASDTFDGLGSHTATCGVLDYTPIYDIQYTTDPSGDSPLAGQTDITTEGIVTALFYNGYFIEDSAGGAWNGLFVYDTNTPALGDHLRINGTVSEYYNLTQMGTLTSYVVLSGGNPLPGPTVVPSGDVSQEQWESVLVRVDNVTVTNGDLGYGEWSISDGSGDMIVDDKGSYTYTPVTGDPLAAVIGPVDYAYGAFKLQPRDDNDIIFELPSYTPIYDIQYTTDPSGDSPLAGQADVTTEGIVTAVFYGSYYIEDPAGGAWNGLYVYDSSGPVIGDHVAITGTVTEYYGLTEMTSLTGFEITSSGNPVPDPVAVLTGDVSQEMWEGVLIRVENVTVTDDNLGYGEWTVSDGSGDVVIDDKGSYTYAPVNGDLLAAVIGPVDYGYGAFKIQPRDDGDIRFPVEIPDIYINETDADTAGTETSEFIELYDGGVGYTPLDGLVVVLFNGSDDQSYEPVFDLDGYTTDANGYFVIGGSSVPGADIVETDTYWLQNGADAVALIVGDATDFPNDTPITTENLVDAIVYDTSDDDDAALLVLLNPGQPQVNERGGGDGESHSNQRCPNGEGGLRNTDTYAQFAPTPGEENTCVVIELGACYDPATFIHEVQGSGPASPEVGSLHVLEGVVVGDFQDTSTQLRGFFLQEEDTDVDGDPLTSEGIFVYDNGFMDVNIGDVVRVLGSVTEYYDLTELTGISDMDVCGTGTASPASVSLPVSSLDVWEQYEGMLINIPQTLYVTGNYYQGRYGEVDLSVMDRLDIPTNVVLPGTAAQALKDLNDRSRIQLEDGSTRENPVPAPYIEENGTLRAGDTLPGLTGVLHFGFGSYEVHPVDMLDFTRVNERTYAPGDLGGKIKIASFNVLNYFTTIDDGSEICGPSGDMGCRGADTPEEFIRQRDKIIAAITAMDSDVIGLMEIENHPTDAALQDLVNGLNDVVGPGTYDYIPTGPVGTDAIKVAFIYKPANAVPVGGYAVLDSSVDPTFIDTKNRPAIAQTFELTSGGGRFTAVVNHLKSKGSDCDDIGDPDIGDGQGNCNLTRTTAAIALTNWLAADPTGSEDPDFIIIGDLNAYAMEDPITAIKDAGYLNLVDAFLGSDAYSYVYAGEKGYLDHALSNSNMSTYVMGVEVWHINADEPSALNYNDYNQPELYQPHQFAASDHDPVIVGFCDAVAPTVEIELSRDELWPVDHKMKTVRVFMDATDNLDTELTIELVSVTSNEQADGLGDGKEEIDIEIVDDFTFKLRAERSGTGDGRIYTITYLVTDACGNSTLAEAYVLVPHNQ